MYAQAYIYTRYVAQTMHKFMHGATTRAVEIESSQHTARWTRPTPPKLWTNATVTTPARLATYLWQGGNQDGNQDGNRGGNRGGQPCLRRSGRGCPRRVDLGQGLMLAVVPYSALVLAGLSWTTLSRQRHAASPSTAADRRLSQPLGHVGWDGKTVRPLDPKSPGLSARQPNLTTGRAKHINRVHT